MANCGCLTNRSAVNIYCNNCEIEESCGCGCNSGCGCGWDTSVTRSNGCTGWTSRRCGCGCSGIGTLSNYGCGCSSGWNCGCGTCCDTDVD